MTAPLPARIQLSRARGWRNPPGAIVVARGTRWGNPFSVAVHGSRAEAAARHRAWLAGEGPDTIQLGRLTYSRAWQLEHLPELVGKTLVCWCPTSGPCHGDTLIELAARTVQR